MPFNLRLFSLFLLKSHLWKDLRLVGLAFPASTFQFYHISLHLSFHLPNRPMSEVLAQRTQANTIFHFKVAHKNFDQLHIYTCTSVLRCTCHTEAQGQDHSCTPSAPPFSSST